MSNSIYWAIFSREQAQKLPKQSTHLESWKINYILKEERMKESIMFEEPIKRNYLEKIIASIQFKSSLSK